MFDHRRRVFLLLKNKTKDNRVVRHPCVDDLEVIAVIIQKDTASVMFVVVLFGQRVTIPHSSQIQTIQSVEIYTMPCLPFYISGVIFRTSRQGLRLASMQYYYDCKDAASTHRESDDKASQAVIYNNWDRLIADFMKNRREIIEKSCMD